MMPAILDLSQHLPSILITVSIVLLTLFILMNLRRRISTRSRAVNPRELIEETREKAVTQSRKASLQSSFMNQSKPNKASPILMFDKDPTKAIVEYDAMVRRLTAHMDTRIAILNKLIRDADERIKRARAITADLPGASISPTNLNTSPTDPQPEITITNNSNTNHTQNHHTPHQNTPSAEPSRMTQHNHNHNHATTKNTTPSTGNNNISPPINHHHQQTDSLTSGIYELADRGLSPIAIAQDLDEHVGKVELILALRPTAC